MKKKIEEIKTMLKDSRANYHLCLATGKYYYGSDEITAEQFREAPDNKHVQISLGSGTKPE